MGGWTAWRTGKSVAENWQTYGTLVVYSRLTSFGQRIFVQDLVTGAETQVSFGPGSDEQPSFCADSYFIAFSSTRGGGHGIYLTTRHGGDAKRVLKPGDFWLETFDTSHWFVNPSTTEAAELWVVDIVPKKK